MIASARVAHLARRESDYGVEGCAVRVNQSRVRDRKRTIGAKLPRDNEPPIQKTRGFELVMGTAAFVGLRRLKYE
jgi:pyruvate/2-oxoglutarate dehydrogenase complex dihydrolipoamide dehydrogenase (E3) component